MNSRKSQSRQTGIPISANKLLQKLEDFRLLPFFVSFSMAAVAVAFNRTGRDFVIAIAIAITPTFSRVLHLTGFSDCAERPSIA